MYTLPALPVTVIGSWARPAWFSQICDDMARRPDAYGEDDRAEILRDATRLAIDDQRSAGADIVTDGEFGRWDGLGYFYERVAGLERQPPTRRLGPPAPEQNAKYVCVAPITAPKGLGLVAQYQQLTELTQAPIKVAAPGPFTLAEQLIGGKVYRDRDAIVEVLSPIVNRELRALMDAEAMAVQIDEPAFACRPENVDAFLRLVERTTAGVRAFVSLHLCFGNDRGRSLGPRSYRPLLPKLSGASVKQLSLEFASREMADVELLAEIKPPMTVAVGLVDVKSHWIEPPELIADRLRTVLKYIDADRVHVAPDCGFGQTARSIACAKLANLAAGTRNVRKERGL